MAKMKDVAIVENDKKTISYRIVKNVSVPSISMKNRDTLIFMPLGGVYIGEPLSVLDKKTGEMVNEKPARFMRITELETGGMYNLMIPTVLEAILDREYGDDSDGSIDEDGNVQKGRLPVYVGKCFVAKKSRREGKKYDDYALDEIKMLMDQAE